MRSKEIKEFEEMRAGAIRSTKESIAELDHFLDNVGTDNKQVTLTLMAQVDRLHEDVKMLETLSVETDSHELIWQGYWRAKLEKGNFVDMNQVKKELADYKVLLEEVPKVYNSITSFSSPFIRSELIIKYVADNYTYNGIAADDLTMMAEDGKVSVEDIRKYFSVD